MNPKLDTQKTAKQASLWSQLPLSLSVAAAVAALSCSVAAQSLLEEVVVTAQKRDQGLQDVGIAVSAFTGDQLRAFDATDSFDIAAYTPGVHISGNLAGQNTQFTIRGVTQNDFNDIIESPNAVYLDEGYIAIAQAQTFALLDLERVEILKGPQGTLFGRNATGGVVSFFSKKPNFEEFEGFVQLDWGQFDVSNDASRHSIEGAFGGPISDTMAIRAAFRHSEQDPYLENLYPQGQPEFNVFGLPFFPIGDPGEGSGADLGDDDTTVGRLTLSIRPSDRLEITLSGNYADSELSTGPYQSKSTIALVEDVGGRSEVYNVIDTPANETRLSILTAGGVDSGLDGGGDGLVDSPFGPGNCAAIGLCARMAPGADFFGYLDPDGDDFTFSSDFAFDDQGSTENAGLNARIEYELQNGMSFVSVTDHKSYKKKLFIDVDAAPVNQLANYGSVDATSLTQEFRLSGGSERSDWVVGAYYLNIDTDSSNALKAPPNSIFGVIALPADVVTIASLETDSYSLFGQYEYQFTDAMRLIGGVRIMREEKDYVGNWGLTPSMGNDQVSYDTSMYIPNAAGAGDPLSYQDDLSESFWTGKLQLDYTPNDDLLIYAGVNRGVKAGSFNAALLGAYLGGGGNAGVPYDEEVLTSFELGFKSTIAGGAARLNGSAYYYDYADYQAFLFVGVGGNSVNLDAETYGAEIELQASPTDRLDLILSASYVDATIEDLPLRNGSPLPLRDVTPTYAPEVQAFAMARYTIPLAAGSSIAIQGDLSYSDEFYYNLRNFDADKFDSYTMVNGLISWTSSDQSLVASLLINNITDERAGIQGFDLATLCGCNEVSYRAPRNWAVQVRKEF
ncbi:MAG: TonB-dependent receptor [Pseudomonadota bacterium]|nr:TonB-dependent receptor [Pseudomonadota bacterium]